MTPSRIGLLATLGALFALGAALALENYGGLVPCALCLWERWPYRIAIALGGLAVLFPSVARPALWLLLAVLLAGVALAGTHVGVEHGFWPSPLPECAAPRISGTTIAERLAHMPDHPAKPCDEPVYLVAALPVSLATLNLLFGLAFAALLAMSLTRRPERAE